MKLLFIILSLCAADPKDQVTKFYNWYIRIIETKEIYELLTPSNNKGQANLRYQPYIDSLRKLNTFDEDFIDSELQLFKPCNSFLEQWTWEKYQLEEPGIDKSCNFLDYHRWFWTQEPVNGFEIFEQSIDGITATVKLKVLDIKGTDRAVMNSEIVVYLKKNSENWLITRIKNSDIYSVSHCNHAKCAKGL